ncbi:MAG: metalloregulator ArsR/SmtB family transcription factor [Bacteroidota bacterium]
MRLKNFSLFYGSQIFKSFSDESRIRILNVLFYRKEACISDLEQILDFTQTKTSRHISYLRNAGLVSSRKADQFIFYTIKDEVYDIVNQIFNFLKRDVQLEKDLDAYDVMYSNRELSANKIENKSWKA